MNRWNGSDDAELAGAERAVETALRLELFSSSLKGLVTPAIAELFLREIPPYLASYHGDVVSAVPIHTPMFFRTDEVAGYAR
jgi:hypothetical protein